MDKRIIANELVPVYETDTGEHVVDGRELHGFLEVGRDFATWIKDRIQKFGFIEDEDFSPVSGKTSEIGGRPTVEYIVKLDMAKELCMVDNNEQGSKARKYFIEVEKRYRAQVIDISRLSTEMQMFRQMWEGLARTQIEQAETQRLLTEHSAKVLQVESTVAVIKDTFLQRDNDWRNSINKMLIAAATRLGGDYQGIRAESYRILEERAGCRLNTRLVNLKDRLYEAGASKTKINETNRMDVIEEERRLREIYTTIVKELSIGSL